MKKVFLVIAALLLATNSYASSGTVQRVFATGTTVSGTGTTVASRVFNLGSTSRMGYWIKGSKANTPEGLSYRLLLEGSYAETPASVFATMATVFPTYQFTTTTTPTATTGTITVPATKYGRFVLEGTTGNATGSTVEMYFFSQEQA